jgi:outer membrane protein assembly factor BamB
VDRTKDEKAVPNPNSGLVWEYRPRRNDEPEGMHASVGSVAVHGGLVIAADTSGVVHCLDACTGKRCWTCDLRQEILSPPLIVDGKIYVTDIDGGVAIFRLSPVADTAMRKFGSEYEPIVRIEMPNAARTAPVFANGVLYLATDQELFAIQEKSTRTRPGSWPR